MFVRPDGRGASSREKEPEVRGPGREPGTEDPRKRQGDRSDVRHKFARLKSPIRFRVSEIADGRQPFMPQEYLTMPAFKSYHFDSRLRGGKRPLSVGRVESAFHPAIDQP